MAPRSTYSRDRNLKKDKKNQDDAGSGSDGKKKRGSKYKSKLGATSQLGPPPNESPAQPSNIPQSSVSPSNAPGITPQPSRASGGGQVTNAGSGGGGKGGGSGGSTGAPMQPGGGHIGHPTVQYGPKHVVELFSILRDYMNKCDLTSYGPKPTPVSNAWTNLITNDRKSFANLANRVLNDMKNMFKSEERMVSVTSPLYVFGDIHGNFNDLRYYERELWSQGPHKVQKLSFIFLGDLVDRGHHSLEVVFYLFCCKLLSRKNTFVLIRGNHELRAIQQAFTFHRECIEKLGPSLGAQIWATINKCFDAMPVACLIDSHIFCCHGGIPMSSQSIRDINNVPCPLVDPENQSPLAWELMWNDPLTNSVFGEMAELLRLQSGSRAFSALKGFLPNNKRGTAYYFSESAALRFMENNNLSHVIRAHECLPTGYTLHSNQKLITVFSSSKYCGGNNDAACVLVEFNDVRVIRLDIGEKNAIPAPSQGGGSS